MKRSPDILGRTVRSRGGLRHAGRFACAAAVAAVTLLGGCGGGAPVVVTPQHVKDYGTALFDASPDTVFRACVVALQMSGQRVEVAESSTGLVVTWPDALAPSEIRPSHGYLVEVRPSPEGLATLVATPTLPDEDAIRRGTPRPRWELIRERALWERLFVDVRSLLDRWGAEAR